jgi:molecular chaperone DnaK (HSP70)
MTQQSHMSRYIVGIDLGTTNIAVSYVDTELDRQIRPFPVSQLVSAGEVDSADMLPSFCYLPGEHELPPGALELPWNQNATFAVGIFAREQGAAIPGRLVSSAKSWLAHGGVDRTSGILPWGGDLGEAALSPVTVSGYYLSHLRAAWDAQFAGQSDRDGTPCVLAEQLVVLTVPASFDEVARELTVRAAREAGLQHLVLLEEPLAAFYSWLGTHEESWQQTLEAGSTVLVVDAGGGTTDFSLITIEEGGTLRRTAVGEHLLLGGDNIDMALARTVEASWKTKLGPREWSILCQQCRQAKEKLLSVDAPAEVKVVLPGSGSSVIGGGRSQVVTRQMLTEILLDGFFPELESTAASPARRAGIRTMGLPYVEDPAVTRHLLAFLRRASQSSSEGPVQPNWILFNGGSLQPGILRRRLSEVVGSWAPAGEPIPELDSDNLNLAVSRGAAYYGLVRYGKGVKVKGGIARAYYLEVHGTEKTELLCVMPRDTDEGHVVKLAAHKFHLAANQLVQFPIYASSTRLRDRAGDIIADRAELTELPPLQTVLNYGKGQQKLLEVQVGSMLNEVGTLEVWCQTSEGHHRYPLSFNLRSAQTDPPSAPEIILEADRIDAALAILQETFAGNEKPAGINRNLTEALGLPRQEWGLSLLRKLADDLLANPASRLRTPQHEARWLNLIGFCLRPGYGAAGDEWRLRQLWKLWHAGPSVKQPQVLAEWWTCWRRLTGGLSLGQQQHVANSLMGQLIPKKSGEKLGPKKAGAQEAAEMWRCLGALERLPVETKLRILKALVQAPGKRDAAQFWVIARVGARRLLYGPENTIIPADRLQKLLPSLFRMVETANTRQAYFAVASLCRRCGVRGLDIADEPRQTATLLLDRQSVPEEWRAQLAEVRHDSRDYQGEVAGDTLPLGLRLVHMPFPQSEPLAEFASTHTLL